MNEAIVYTRLATDLLKKLKEVEDDTLTEEDPTTAKLGLVLEAFQAIDNMAEDRHKKLHEHSSQHLPEDSGTVN